MPPRTDTPAAGVPVTGPARRLGRVEFTAFLAMSMALAALGVDVMLPAFPEIRESLGLPPDATQVAALVTAYFLGLALGQLVYGPLADRYGRRRALVVGYAVYGVGALLSAFGPTLLVLFVSRFIWGLGAAGPRVAALAMVRDRYEGEEMARQMSFIMAVFILVPVIAPSLGALALSVTTWRVLFALCAVAALGLLAWLRRVPETLAPQHQLPMSARRVAGAARTVVSSRQTVAYTLALTALYGVFTSWIASSEVILTEVFGQGDRFPLIFGGLAATMGLAMVANGNVVRRIGTRRLAHGVLFGYLVAAALLTTLALTTGGRPPLPLFVAGMVLMLCSHALLLPNFNTIALAPMGAVAGTASAVTGAVQVAVGALLGSLLDQTFDGTVRPLAIGFLGYGLLAMALVLWAERGRLFQPLVTSSDVEAEARAEPEVA